MDLVSYLPYIITFTISFPHGSGEQFVNDCSSTCYCARDCKDLKATGFVLSGIYRVTPVGTSRGFDVYCDMAVDGGGWTVFQRRQDGTVDFERGWVDYELGFGDPSGEHWLGNLPLYILLRQGHHELRVDLEDWEGRTKHAKYRYFKIGGPSEQYNMNVAGFSGDAGNVVFVINSEGDALGNYTGSAFSTKDRDNDSFETYDCARAYNGSWWYGACHRSNLNGLYLKGHHESLANGVVWIPFRGWKYSLKTTEMKIRRV